MQSLRYLQGKSCIRQKWVSDNFGNLVEIDMQGNGFEH